MKTVVIAAVSIAIACAAPAHADDSDVQFISFLEAHNLGCGEGALKCSSDVDLIEVGHSVCYDIDHNGQTVYEAADKLVQVGQGWLNKNQSYEIVAAAVVNYCPWDRVSTNAH